MDRSHKSFHIRRLVRGSVASAALFGALFLGAMPALAGVGLGVTPTFPATVRAGQTLVPASLQIAWANSQGNGNEGHANNVTGIQLTPTCGAFINSVDCPSAPTDFRDPGIFTLSSSSTSAVGCGGVTTFTIALVDAPSGKVAFTPGFQLPVNGVCTISFTLDVNATATKDADPPRSGVQTAVLAGATATDAVNNNPGGGLGSAEISFITISTTPGAGGTLGTNGVPPVNLSDSATLTGLVPDNNNNPPTGTVTFRLFAPGDPTCGGTPFGSQVVDLTSCSINPTSFLTTCATSSTFTANQPGIWHWTAAYSGNAQNQSLTSGCAAEPVTVSPANPTIQTTPDPTTGTVLATPLGDIADLEGGYFPTGTITFLLYPPSDPTCAGPALGTTPPDLVPRVANVDHGNGIYTSGNLPKRFITQTGTYHWKAVYSGDANNNSVTSPCADEPVVVTKPVLQIVKTPDNGTINAGATATFTIVVTNLGPGVAKNGTISDPLPAGGGVTWTTSTNGCTVSGAVGAQTLNCFMGNDLNPNATFTAVVSAVTSVAHCAVMDNTATAVATNADQVSDPGKITCNLPATPTLQTTPIPTSGTMLVTPLGDSANLQGGNAPTGTITFSLYPPSDPTCVGTPLGTTPPDVVLLQATVNGNGTYNSGNLPKRFITQTGTYHWKASYSGDVNNNPVTSQCADEPVVITKPVLSIAKTPDNGTITAGDTATFTIVVTNLGPGIAKNGTISDPLPAGGGVTWATSSAGCTVSGAVGSQTLNCFMGVDLAENATFTAVVTAVTSLAHCTVMDNTATAVATNASQVSNPGKITCSPPPQVGMIAHTSTTCQDYLNGVGTLGQVDYDASGGTVAHATPGVMFYYAKITTTMVNQVVTTSQSHNGTAGPLFQIHQGQASLYTAACGSAPDGTPINGDTGASYTIANPGTYVIGIKYSVKSIEGQTAPVPSTITSTFTTSLGPSTSASVLLVETNAAVATATSRPAVSSPAAFSCSNFEPIECLTMSWTGPGSIRITGTAGNTAFDMDDIKPGDLVTQCGYNGTQPDALWDIYQAGTTTKIGQSKFSLMCPDTGVNGQDDCFLAAGDNDGTAVCNLDANTEVACTSAWNYEGMAGNSQVLDCNALANASTAKDDCEASTGGGRVTHHYSVYDSGKWKSAVATTNRCAVVLP